MREADEQEPDDADIDGLAEELGVDPTKSRKMPVQMIALALVISFPFLKIFYVTQSSAIAGEVIRLLGPMGWIDTVIDNILRYQLPFLLLYALISGSSLPKLVRSTVRRFLGHRDIRQQNSRSVTLLLDLVAPGIGFLWGLVLFGPAWALAIAAATLVFSAPSDLFILRNIFRVRKGLRPSSDERKVRGIERVMFYVAATLLLPLSLAYTALDGEAWASVRSCAVESVTQGTHTARIVEISRAGMGIVTAWEIGTNNIVAGGGCVDSSYEVRGALWERN
ncbi:hypothetical protein [Glutamicibacter endophyticus]|uniref:hypothetical protein n=1 Tax=Glutamicibacter endophyticus TaxID=1522174 RepID=UPI003AF1A5CB